MSKIKILGFDWNKGNQDKNWQKHKVNKEEAEEIFYNEPVFIFKDVKHSVKEERFVAYGISDQGRGLTVVFSLREKKIRIISARDQSRKERRIHEKTESDT